VHDVLNNKHICKPKNAMEHSLVDDPPKVDVFSQLLSDHWDHLLAHGSAIKTWDAGMFSSNVNPCHRLFVTLWQFNIAMENHTFEWENPL
jgi:hypothetical protein